MHVFEELHVVGGVHAQHRFEPVFGRRNDGPEAGGFDRGADPQRAFGYLRRIEHVSLVVERDPRVMLEVRVRGEREHASSCSTAAPIAGSADDQTPRGGRYPRAVTPLTVSVWTVDLDQPPLVVDALRAFLDPDEVLAAAARTNDVVRNRYVVAHGALRSILASRLGITPEAVTISRHCARCGDANHGKPTVVPIADLPASQDLAFSLSHSQSYAVVAVVSGARVGVDIEAERPRVRLEALAERVLGTDEYAEWLGLEPAAQLRGFLRFWTAKEAYLKAIGAGVTLPLRDVPVEPEGWTVSSFPAPPGTVARVRGGGMRGRERRGMGPARERGARLGARCAADRQVPQYRGRFGVRGRTLGLRDVLEPEKDEKVAIVQDYAGNPPFKDPIVLRLDPDHPEDSIVMVRPWLRNPPADSADD